MLGTGLKCYVCSPEDRGVKCNDDVFVKNQTLLKNCSTLNNQTIIPIGCAKIDIHSKCYNFSF